MRMQGGNTFKGDYRNQRRSLLRGGRYEFLVERRSRMRVLRVKDGTGTCECRNNLCLALTICKRVRREREEFKLKEVKEESCA